MKAFARGDASASRASGGVTPTQSGAESAYYELLERYSSQVGISKSVLGQSIEGQSEMSSQSESRVSFGGAGASRRGGEMDDDGKFCF
jgi:hypothetical protein